jgi:hypothetical protein
MDKATMSPETTLMMQLMLSLKMSLTMLLNKPLMRYMCTIGAEWKVQIAIPAGRATSHGSCDAQQQHVVGRCVCVAVMKRIRGLK